ncbi:MAG: hypothetical protein KAR11_06325 [Phycisphaerae bacterium]|nr:hypothetical protein [Phycisphaerae bacterium]
MISKQLRKCLDDLAARIDLEQERINTAAWINFIEGNVEGEVFCPPLRKEAPANIEWPEINLNDAFDDPDSMLISEFKMVSDRLDYSSGQPLNVRCNYGTGILPTLFGCEMFMMDRELNTLSPAIPLHDKAKIQKLLDSGLPDMRAGLGARVFDTGELFMEVFEQYPIIAEAVELYHPDIQGPIDVGEVVWGSEIFLVFYDDPEMLRAFLQLVTDTYIAFLRKWYEIVPVPKDGYSRHWGMLIKGIPALRNDSLMNLSPELYAEFVRPMDQQIFDEFGGGIIHFCGRGDHFIEPMSEMRGLNGIAMSQPEYNDMEKIYCNTVDKKIPLLGLPEGAVQDALSQNRPLRGMVVSDRWCH